jgi:hypothetical protein
VEMKSAALGYCACMEACSKESGDGGAESLLFLTPFMSPVVSFVSVMYLM